MVEQLDEVVGVTGNGRGRFSQRGRLNSPISRLGCYLHGLDHYNLHPIPDPSTFQSHEEFTVDELQSCGLINCGNVCPIISIFLCFHRLRLRDQMTDPLLCMTDRHRPSLILHKILHALPSEESFSIFQFILSWNKERILPEITQAEFGDVRELLDRFVGPEAQEGLFISLKRIDFARVRNCII